jgi:hypothetical protein
VLILKSVVIAIHDQPRCKTPYLFRSYDHPPSPVFNPFQRNPGAKASIPLWQVARATSASSTYFPRITIDGKDFFDSGTTFQNPALDAFLEAEQMSGSNQGAVALTISVGTGAASKCRKQRTISSPCGKDVIDKSVMQSETTNRIVEELCEEKETRYFRFNVDYLDKITADDWGCYDSNRGFMKRSNSIDRIDKLTRQYLDRKDIRQQVVDAAFLLRENEPHQGAVAPTPGDNQGARADQRITDYEPTEDNEDLFTSVSDSIEIR